MEYLMFPFTLYFIRLTLEQNICYTTTFLYKLETKFNFKSVKK